MTPHSLLKAATRSAHETVDASFAVYDLANEKDYGRFLLRHAAAFVPVEQALSAAGANSLVVGWDDHLRSDALRADLADLGLAPPPPLAAPPYGTEAEVLGGAYVLEGSRLGGAVLRKSIGAGLPSRFLDSGHPPGRWRAFVAQLNHSLYHPDSLSAATQAAIGTFALFA